MSKAIIPGWLGVELAASTRIPTVERQPLTTTIARSLRISCGRKGSQSEREFMSRSDGVACVFLMQFDCWSVKRFVRFFAPESRFCSHSTVFRDK